uniref:Uncharacterized protein n=1 Tax=Salmonella phage vB_SEnST11_KE23 TaxID=3161174 RepID=A0AAU8GF23_9CAUD
MHGDSTDLRSPRTALYDPETSVTATWPLSLKLHPVRLILLTDDQSVVQII